MWRAGEVTLHCVTAGDGNPVVLLHGFPEFWYSWRHQIPALAQAGFHAIAPDMRGYNLSDRPREVSHYRIRRLVGDIAALLRAIGRGPVDLVGHDWGGVVAWRVAALHPELIRKLVVLNAPHPSRFAGELVRNPLQWLRSSYVMFFQLPWLPEQVLRARNYEIIERAFRTQPVHPSAFSEADIAAYKQTLSRSRGLRGPLNYYRAAARYPRDLFDGPQRVLAPTLLVWGQRDPFLSVRLTEGLERWVPDLRVVRIADSSHWVQNDVPDQVNHQLLTFFRG